MLIVSSFHDYYDTTSKLGIDKTIIFKREEKELFNNTRDYEKINITLTGWNYNNSVTIGNTYDGGEFFIGKSFIIFCNQFIPFIYVKKEYYDRWDLKNSENCYYNSEQFIDLLSEEIFNNLSKEEIKKNIEKARKSKRWFIHQSLYRMTDYFDSQTVKEFKNRDWIELHRQYNSPIFISAQYKRSTPFIVNPCLKNFQFQKYKDPFTAFQEIQGFISGVIGSKERDIVYIDDKSKIAKHGFDKFSFRKQATKK